MLQALLIANRGEIACRIIETAKRLGVRTIAVYSDADKAARHVRLADEAHWLGPAPASESYLNIDRLIDVARQAGADAVHPGYGFLSENADFAQACESAGLIFVGPRPDAIRAMGSKRIAKDLMHSAGVAVVPDYRGADQSIDAFATHAAGLGYPVMLKPAHGGGGKGMRRVDRAEDLAEALASAKREAVTSFGDDEILVEKYIHQPRHIEVQVFGDTHGNIVHLYERDCTLQRRHQKVIEEAPAYSLTNEVRQKLQDAAIRAAAAVNYTNAGTVEFLVDTDGAFYFMEMNTRIQVEHPVTEMITGLDLIDWQLRVASGEALPLRQDDIRVDGHAIEARVYAESPDRGFLPSPGRIDGLLLPSGPHLRVDRGVERGDVVTPHYDAMIAKIIVHGSSREEARQRLLDAVLEVRIDGVESNLAFLAALLARPEYQAGDVDAQYVDRSLGKLVAGDSAPAVEAVAAAALVLSSGQQAMPVVPSDPWDDRRGWQNNLRPRHISFIALPNGLSEVVLVSTGGATYRLEWTDLTIGLEMAEVSGKRVGFSLGGRRHDAIAVMAARTVHLISKSGVDRIDIADPFASYGGATTFNGAVVAPMPGKVTHVFVVAGQAVSVGDRLAVVEAMKMEHVLRAPIDSTVTHVHVTVGQFVDEGTVLVALHLVPD